MILVLITAYGTEALEDEVRRLGIGYITKPFELSSLVQLIRGREKCDGTENQLRALIPKDNHPNVALLLGRVFTDPDVPDL